MTWKSLVICIIFFMNNVFAQDSLCAISGRVVSYTYHEHSGVPDKLIISISNIKSEELYIASLGESILERGFLQKRRKNEVRSLDISFPNGMKLSEKKYSGVPLIDTLIIDPFGPFAQDNLYGWEEFRIIINEIRQDSVILFKGGMCTDWIPLKIKKTDTVKPQRIEEVFKEYNR